MIQLTHRRERWQSGSLKSEPRKTGAVWIYRWREKDHAGNVVKRKRIIGTKKEYLTETAARRAVEALRLDINTEVVTTSSMTVSELATHYIARELGEGTDKRVKTVSVYNQHLNTYIIPRWGSERIGSIVPTRVEEWLKSLPMADGTKAKTKAVFSALYQHAMRYRWVDINPIRSVRQSAKPQNEPDVLTDVEAAALLAELPGHARAMAVLAATTGLRRGELVGLQWHDIDFDSGLIHIRRSYVDGVAAEPKTRGSKRPVPMEAALASVLSTWRSQTKFSELHHFVFVSPFHAGTTPYWPSTVLTKVIRPAALAVGISKVVGWHTFRRTVATLLVAQGENVKTTQETLRHSTPTVTMGLYAQAIPEDRRTAQSRIAERLKLPAPNVPYWPLRCPQRSHLRRLSC